MVFDDLTMEEARTGYSLPKNVRKSIHKIPDEDLIELLKERNINIISDTQAQEIAGFVLEHKEETDVLVCQCHYGISRSAACAAAVAEYYYGNGKSYFSDYRYHPNKRVYKKVLRELTRESE
jgi:predicted protein tyrosine phosphatase